MDKRAAHANGSQHQPSVYVQQKQHEALERMGVLLNTAAETIQQSICTPSQAEAQKQGKRGNERETRKTTAASMTTSIKHMRKYAEMSAEVKPHTIFAQRQP